MDRLDNEFDAVLTLLDRQVIDSEGLLVCKVDDVELDVDDGGPPRVVGILAGAPALLPRFSGHLGETLLDLWERLGIEQSRRRTPWRIDFDLVERVDSAVHLSVRREHLLGKPREPATDGTTYPHRLDQLLGMTVQSGGARQETRSGAQLGKVIDVRMAPGPGGRSECTRLVVGRGRPGSLLGYDRSDAMGPAVLSHAVRWLHRHTGQLPFSAVTDLDWDNGTIQVDSAGIESLTHT